MHGFIISCRSIKQQLRIECKVRACLYSGEVTGVTN